jgi:tetratricopeptide (TPR) repeat protein
MLGRILNEFKRHSSLNFKIPDQPEELKAVFSKVLPLISTKEKVVLVIDGLDQLEDRDQAPDLGWLPRDIPANLRIIVSCLPGRSLDELTRRGWPRLEVQPLAAEERKELAIQYLLQYAKALNSDCLQKIITADQASSPLYLRTLLEELRLFGTHEKIEERIRFYLAAGSVDQLFKKVLARYEQDYEGERPGLVGDTMRLIWAARRGLSEAEILDLLGSGGDPMPRAYWSQLHLAAESLLVNRSGLVSFFHSYLRQAVEQKYLTSEEEKQSAHLQLAAYFNQRELGRRKLDETPWQFAQARRWPDLAGLLADPDFFRMAWMHNRFEVLSFWRQVEENSAFTILQAYQTILAAPEKYVPDGTLALLSDLFFTTAHYDEAWQGYDYLSNHSENEAEQAFSFVGQASCLMQRRKEGDLEVAIQLLETAVTLYRSIQDNESLAAALGNLSTLYYECGWNEQALQALDEMRLLEESVGGNDLLAHRLGNEALRFVETGNFDQALALHQKEEALYRDLADIDGLQISLGNQATTLMHEGRLDEALILLQKQEALCQQIGKLSSLANCYSNQAYLWFKKGNYPRALASAKKQEEIAEQINDNKQKDIARQSQKAILEAQKGH